ncbi:hypothetical protein SAMN05216170_0574 [Thermococcus thioreducens]|uniref:Uncharacterized protein n=1 Tax=Thermococcus thioreducens TaxID=277988 RepID=A0A1I0MH49_9EURY|nr:hypothetical protein SAMN05216170_0574 [Thermococcus thioreducens]
MFIIVKTEFIIAYRRQRTGKWCKGGTMLPYH